MFVICKILQMEHTSSVIRYCGAQRSDPMSSKQDSFLSGAIRRQNTPEEPE